MFAQTSSERLRQRFEVQDVLSNDLQLLRITPITCERPTSEKRDSEPVSTYTNSAIYEILVTCGHVYIDETRICFNNMAVRRKET